MFHVNERGDATHFLYLGNDMLANGCFARGFGSVDFGDAPAGDAANTEGDIKGERAGGIGLGLHVLGFSQTHNGTFTVAFEDISDGFIEHSTFCAIYVIVGCCQLFGGRGFG